MVAFVDREGGSFFQEWSGLFVMEEDSGGRICYFYPRLSPTTALSATAAGFQREEASEVTKPVAAIALRAAFVAMPHTDENDSQLVLCYRSYFPASQAAVY